MNAHTLEIYALNMKINCLQKNLVLYSMELQKHFKNFPKSTNSLLSVTAACGYIEVMLSTSGLDKYVTDTLCFGQTNTSKGKTIRTLMERNNLKDVVYVGDTQGDADACKEADVPFIFAEYGFGNVPDAKTRIKDITDLTTLF